MRPSDSTPFCAFIANVAFEATADEVEAEFQRQIGGVARVILLVSRERAGHIGRGFIHFDDENYLAIAIKDSGSIRVRGRPVFIEAARNNLLFADCRL